jgi:hypothetical protein
MKKLWFDLFYSFPVQLLRLHIRHNLALLFIWVLLFLGITGNLGSNFGVYYLFVSPEYLGAVNTYSFFLVGIAYGVFVMCWHLSVYLLYAWRFPFLATIRRPFIVFCYNNSLLPFIFFIIYFYHQISFERLYEMQNMREYLSYSAGFATGSVMLIVLLSLYFAITNKNVKSFSGNKSLQILLEKTDKRHRQAPSTIRAIRVDFFINEVLKLRKIRDTEAVNPEISHRVLQQNHYNALFLQCAIVLTFLYLGRMSDHATFRLPAGASIFLLSSFAISVMGALSFWFRRWQYIVLFLLMVSLNFFTNLDYFNQTSKAFGLDFNRPPVSYTTDSLKMLCRAENVISDKTATQNILKKWQTKHNQKGKKPPMIIVCVSGGGLKATAWSMRVLQTADSLSKGQFMAHTTLMTGASGGMLGAAYFRELLLRKQLTAETVDLHGNTPYNDVTKDLLNAVSFSILTNDLFLPRLTYEMGTSKYRKDRGYAFERQFHENTAYRLYKKLSDYALPEQNATIPLLFVTPSVLNDGRMMVISPQPVSYMMTGHSGQENEKIALPDAVDFGALFKHQQANELLFSTALRANATFPLILPNILLPTQPAIELVDAGFRDNVGLKSALRFVHTFEDWISENTSSVTFVVIRAYETYRYAPNSAQGGLLGELFNPLSFASNFLTLQEYEYQNELGFLRNRKRIKNINILDFTYIPSKKLQNSPTSFHLTALERTNISSAIQLPANKMAFQKLLEVLNP